MCMFCASIPAAAAVGARLNADQVRRMADGQSPSGKQRSFPFPVVTTLIILFLCVASFLNHTLGWRLY